MKFPAWLSVILTTFAGAAIGAVEPSLTNGVPPASQWRPMLVTALVAGVAAVLHLFQSPPNFGAARAVERGFARLWILCILSGLALLMMIAAIACTKAQAVNDVAAVLSDTQAACVIAEDIITVTPLAPDLAALEAACGIATGAEVEVQKVLSAYFAQEAAALKRVRASVGIGTRDASRAP